MTTYPSEYTGDIELDNWERDLDVWEKKYVSLLKAGAIQFLENLSGYARDNVWEKLNGMISCINNLSTTDFKYYVDSK